MLTFDDLKRKLWQSADILRGSIDSGEYKTYIFGFLFLKRLSDVFEEEAERILRETGDPDLAYNEPDEHPFFVPLEARWDSLLQHSEGIGNALNIAAQKLEDQNPSLNGIVASIDFNDARKLGDQKHSDMVLGRLVKHFSSLNLRHDNLENPDVLGNAYEYLIEQFADDAGKKGGEFYTPRQVVELLVKLLEPVEGQRICDPTCGSGGMLIEAVRYVRESGNNPKNLSLYGQEKNRGTWAIAKMNLILHGIQDFRIEAGDTLRDPKLLQDGRLILFDLVMANPPFSLDGWGAEDVVKDKYKRFARGIPPKSKGDLAFIQHMVSTLNGTGRAGVVVPHGVLFRGGKEGQIRESLVREDLLEAVIGLPTNLFHGTGIPAALLIFDKQKKDDPARAGRVLFIDAHTEYDEGRNRNFLSKAGIARTVRAHKRFDDEKKFARVVPMTELEHNEFNLNISRYVVTRDPEATIDLNAALERLREAERGRAEAEAHMNALLRELGFGA